MPDFIAPLLGILVSMIILTVLSSFFAKFLVRIAQYFKVKDVIVAVLLLGLVGSIGELNIGLTALIIGYQESVLGLVIGVAITMILLVGGITTLYNDGIPTRSETHSKIMPVLDIAVLIFILLVSDGQLTQIDGIILVLIFLLYVAQVIRIKDNLQVKSFKALTTKKELTVAILAILLIVVNLFLTAGFTMQGVYNFVSTTNIGLFIVGITLLAPFSVIPELVFELEISKNGTSKTALSDIVTSCVANLTLVIGLVAIIQPFSVVQGNLLNFNLFMLALVIVIFNIYSFSGRKLDKREGIIMLVVFFVYMVTNYLLIAA